MALESDFGPAEWNVRGVVCGDGWSTVVTITQGGVPFSLVGVTLEAKIRPSRVGAPSQTLSATVYGPAVNGQLQLQLAEAATTALGPGQHSWSVRAKPTGGTFRTLVGGVFELEREPTSV